MKRACITLSKGHNRNWLVPFAKKYLVLEYYFTDFNNSSIRNWNTAFQKFEKFENGVTKIWNILKIGRRQMNEAYVPFSSLGPFSFLWAKSKLWCFKECFLVFQIQESAVLTPFHKKLLPSNILFPEYQYVRITINLLYSWRLVKRIFSS